MNNDLSPFEYQVLDSEYGLETWIRLVAAQVFSQFKLFYKGGKEYSDSLDYKQLKIGTLNDFKGIFRKTHVQWDMTLPECMTLTEYSPTTIFSVKLMHLCT